MEEQGKNGEVEVSRRLEEFGSKAKRVEKGVFYAEIAGSPIRPEFWYSGGQFDRERFEATESCSYPIPPLPRAVHPLSIEYTVSLEGEPLASYRRQEWPPRLKERNNLPVAFYAEDPYDYVFGGRVHLYFLKTAGQLGNGADFYNKEDFIDPFAPDRKLRGLFMGAGGVISVGPDGDEDIDPSLYGYDIDPEQVAHLVHLTYDPTNGTLSSGDLIYPPAKEIDY